MKHSSLLKPRKSLPEQKTGINMSFRKEKLQRLIKEEIGWIFLYKLKDPSFGFVTITNVKLSPDLKIARIYFSVLQRENRQTVLDRINEAKSLIRTELAQKVKMRFVPDLQFYVDDTTDYVEKIENIFKKIREDENGDRKEPDGSAEKTGADDN